MASEHPQRHTTEAAGADLTGLARLIDDGEEWLMARILHYAKAHGYTPHTSTLLEAWRLSITGLSASLKNALERPPASLELHPEADYTQDPVAAFGVAEAHRHRERGVDLGMFLGLMKYYRQAYHDLINSIGRDPADQDRYHHCIGRCFDRMEIGFVTTWAAIEDDAQLSALQAANREMTNEKNKYLTVFESLPIAVILIDDDLIVETMNDTARQMVGGAQPVPPSYYRRRPASSEEAGAAAPHLGALFPWLADSVAGFARENQPGMYFIKDVETGGRRRHYHIRLSRMLDVSDKFTGTLVFIEDVSERVQAERTLAENGSFLRTVLNAIQDGISVLDTDYTILQVNQAMEAWYRSEDKLIGRHCYEAYHGRDTHCEVCPSRRAMKTGHPQVDEVPLMEEGEQRGWLEIFAYPLIADDGSVSGFVEYIRNVTERRKGEAAMRESEQLNVVLETAGAVGHELNQPLQSVMGQCELMFLDLDAASPLYPRMKTIRDQVSKMGEITRKLMSITRYRTKRYGKSAILDLEQSSAARGTGSDQRQ